MLVFYCCLEGACYGSGVTWMILKTVPNFKEQLVDYYGVIILPNLRNFVGQTVFYWFYGGVPLFNNFKRNIIPKTFFSLVTSFTSINFATPFTYQKKIMEQTPGSKT